MMPSITSAKSELAAAFYEGLAKFFEEIPNSVRAATRPVLEIMDEGGDTAHADLGNGAQAGAVSIGTPKGDTVEVFFGNDEDGNVALRIDLKAGSFKALSALIDIASAGMVGLDGVSMVEHWAAR
jgi:hypothetical protein